MGVNQEGSYTPGVIETGSPDMNRLASVQEPAGRLTLRDAMKLVESGDPAARRAVEQATATAPPSVAITGFGSAE
jgi:hypothetical protein